MVRPPLRIRPNRTTLWALNTLRQGHSSKATRASTCFSCCLARWSQISSYFVSLLSHCRLLYFVDCCFAVWCFLSRPVHSLVRFGVCPAACVLVCRLWLRRLAAGRACRASARPRVARSTPPAPRRPTSQPYRTLATLPVRGSTTCSTARRLPVSAQRQLPPACHTARRHGPAATRLFSRSPLPLPLPLSPSA